MNEIINARWSSIMSEIKKCTLLCGNCHFMLHRVDSDSRYRENMNALMRVMRIDVCHDCELHEATDFHHNEGEKRVNISDVLIRKATGVHPIQFIIELDKCIPLCRNCHKRRHFNSDRYERLLPLIMKKKDCYQEQRFSVKEAVEQMLDAGMTQGQIVSELGCAKSTVSRWANVIDPENKRNFGCNRKLDWLKIKELVSRGYSSRQIAEEIGASIDGVKGVRKKINKGEI